MSAPSTIYLLKDWNRRTEGSRKFELYQEFYGSGAHGIDMFTTAGNNGLRETFMVIPNYYECENKPPGCKATSIFKWNMVSYSFNLEYGIESAGPAQTTHFKVRSGEKEQSYLVIAENFISEMSLYKFYEDSLVKLGSHRVPGVAACASVEVAVSNEVHVIGASYNDGSWATSSRVFMFDSKSERLVQIQLLDTLGAHDVEAENFNDQTFLAFAEDRNDKGPLISSSVSESDSIQLDLI
jgi:hypothetical protein